MKLRIVLIVVLVSVMVILQACSAAATLAPTATPTPPPTVTETPRPSETPAPTDTSTPSPTSTFTLTPSATITSTSTSTPMPSFAGFAVEYAQYTNYGMLMGFKIPGITKAYRLKVNDIAYTCNLNDKAPGYLYCYGPQFQQNQEITLVFYPPDENDNTPLYTASYKVSLLVPPTVDPRVLMTEAPGSCPARGIHVTCETEYRKDGAGGCCIVATCSDACGYYYSMDTCPNGSEHNGICAMTGTPPLPGNR